MKKEEKSKKQQKSTKKSQKNAKKDVKLQKIASESKNKHAFVWFLAVSTIAVVCLLSCQFFFENALTSNAKFYENTKINGIDVSNMTMAEAENVVLTDMLQNLDEIEINLSYKDKNWKINGTDFEVTNKLEPYIKEIASYGKTGNFFQNMKKSKEIKEKGIDFHISYKNVLANFEDKLNDIILEVEEKQVPASLVFDTTKDFPFEIDRGKSSVTVLRDQLFSEISSALQIGKVANVEIPIVEIPPEFNEEELKESVCLRSEFTTSYTTSKKDRKENIKKALESFNGLVVDSNETISFNEITGPRTEENGYKNAKVIFNGVYVDGVGGGVCQASTTLYNALILADIQIDRVCHHTLPASYVPLSFDAMVSGDYADLVFTNNLEKPIYIRTTADENEVKVEIFGEKMEYNIERRAELVKIIPHNGDKILPDEKGQYEDKILYKGEYYRLKWPKEGYESKGYLRYYKDGELQKEKEIRHDFYVAQDGIVIEGVEELGEGMKLPNTDVTICTPQKVSKETEESVRKKLAKENPSEYSL